MSKQCNSNGEICQHNGNFKECYIEAMNNGNKFSESCLNHIMGTAVLWVKKWNLDEHTVDELMQKFYLKLQESISKFDPEKAKTGRTYVYKMIYYILSNDWKKQERRQRLQQERLQDDVANQILNEDQDFELKQDIQDCIDRLSPEQKKLIFLYYFENTTLKDIALLALHESERKTQIKHKKAKQSLHFCLKEKGYFREKNTPDQELKE